MVLGNTGGGNTGKQYLTKRRMAELESKLTAADYKRLDEFNTWYVYNLESLDAEWQATIHYDEDVFTDTYIRICEVVLYKGLDIQHYRAYFSRAYLTNVFQKRQANNRYIQTDDSFEFAQSLNNEEDNTEELNEAKRELANRIIDFVKSEFNKEHASFFVNYLKMKTTEYPATYKILGKRMGVSYTTAYNRVTNIKKRVLTEFSEQRKSVL